MKTNLKNRTIYCHQCNEYITMQKIFVDFLYEGSVSDIKDHLLGNTSDREWIKLTEESRE